MPDNVQTLEHGHVCFFYRPRRQMGVNMASSRDRRLARILLERSGRLWSEELGVKLEKNTPSVLFRWLCASILLSARIGHELAMQAARALAERDWTTAGKLAQSTWDQRTKTLNRSGYARYDERTSRMLGQVADLLVDHYHGDLRRLRDAAEQEPDRERTLLKEFKGLGDVGVDIFFREVQIAWDELRPFADRKALTAARRLKLGSTPEDLVRLVRPAEFPRLVAALVRTDLNRDYDDVRAAVE